MLASRWISCCAALATGAAALWFLGQSDSRAFTTVGHTLGLDQRDVRIFNNFADPSANDNVTPDANWPGALGAPLAVWKAVAEWGSRLHGNGQGDPSQPGDLGSGGANFDAVWQGLAPGVGGVNDNVISATTSGCGGGVTEFLELGSSGWRIRLCDDFLWDDGPGVVLTAGALDLQGVVAHSYGHALGLGHSTVGGSTMFPSISGNGVSSRSLSADDIAGVQFLYGVADPAKPRVDDVLVGAGQVTVVGANFAPANNELWFTLNGGNPDGELLVLAGVSSSNGARIHVALPAGAGPGDVLVRVPGAGGASLSNAFPVDPNACSPAHVYCTAQTNSIGCTSSISSTGQASASSGSGFVVRTDAVLNHVTGIFFYGKNGPQATPFLGGTLCAVPPVLRSPALASGGSPPPTVDCSGAFTFDFNGYVASGVDAGLVAGQGLWIQCWSRDPQAAPSPTNLSDALAAVLCP